VNSERVAFLCGILVLVAGGAALKPLEREMKTARAWGGPAVGGIRAVAADWLWLQTDLAWEQRDPVRTRYLLGLTLAAEPESVYFWSNGARMLAYDLPSWDTGVAGAGARGVQAHRRKLAAWEALRLLQRGLRCHPGSAALQVEMGNICLYALGDREQAAEHYRLAAALPDAPSYADRIYRRLREKPR
jgi:hypothetical protein